MKILFIGDVVGQEAARKLADFLPSFKHDEQVDVTIVNGENSANGNGITPFSANLLLGVADVVTTGNHCFKRYDMYSMYEENSNVIRPYNFGADVPGKGYAILDFGKYSLAVVNLLGNVYMLAADNAFKAADEVLAKISTPNIIVDFHAEATAEKKAMAHYLAGRVSGVIGTHTHVQTADEQIVDNVTAFISDVGMTGSHDSIIGSQKEGIINRFATYLPTRHAEAVGGERMNAVMITIDPTNGRAANIVRINLEL